MFIPFLPLIIAFIALGAFTQIPVSSQASLAWSPWEMLFIFMVFSILIGQVSSRYLGERSILKLSRRRLLVLGIWWVLIYLNRTEQNIPSLIENFTFNKEFSFFALLLAYWMGDALCLNKITQWNQPALLQKSIQTLLNLRLQLPILLLIGVQFGILQMTAFLFVGEWQQHLFVFLSSLIVMMMFGPFIMVSCWGAGSLRSKHAEEIIQKELSANGVAVNRILSWPEHVLSTATAGVIGIIPGCRYLLISEQLIHCLTIDELRSVIAHEAGHLKKHHLVFFVLSFLTFNGVLVFSWYAVYGLQWLFIWEVSIWPYMILAILGFFLFFRIIMGFLSRNFERQADCNSLERIGYEPFKQALLKVAWLNGIDPNEDNWHHYGIKQRLKFVHDCVVSPHQIQVHHRRVFKIKFSCICLALLFFNINVFATSEEVQHQFFQYFLSKNFQSLEQSGHADPLLLQQMTYLATYFHMNHSIDQAEAIYRKILKVSPNNTVVLNNLAWLLARHYEDSSEKIEESIKLARLATQQEDTAFIWDTLAESYFKAGNNQQAFKAAQRALALAEQGIGINSEAGLDYYQERSAYFYQLIQTNP